MLLGFIALQSCKKNKNDEVIPKVYVDIFLYLDQPDNVVLNTVNNWKYQSGGNLGIIIFRKSQNEFVALERTCTYNHSGTYKAVSVQSNNISATDTTCGSTFQITDGSVTHGPASRSLVQYHTEYDASNNTLRIYN